jgi:hypothetical protein
MSPSLKTGLNTLLVAACAALSPHGVAHAASGLDSQVAACRAIADDARRLACYDRMQQGGAAPQTGEAAATLAMPAAAASAAAAPAAPAVTAATPAAPQGFGAETVTRPIAVEAQKDLQAKVRGSITALRRGMVLELDNGQSWRSIDDREYDCEGDNPAVTISRNFAGSYWLQMEHCPYHLRVTRVQ